MKKPYIIITTLFLLLLSCSNTGSSLVEDNTSMKITLLNCGTLYEKTCITEKAEAVAACVDRGEIEPYRVKIFQDHPIVKEALEGKTVKIIQDEENRTIFISVKNGSQRIIIKTNGQYGLYKVKSDISFAGCLKKP